MWRWWIPTHWHPLTTRDCTIIKATTMWPVFSCMCWGGGNKKPSTTNNLNTTTQPDDCMGLDRLKRGEEGVSGEDTWWYGNIQCIWFLWDADWKSSDPQIPIVCVGFVLYVAPGWLTHRSEHLPANVLFQFLPMQLLPLSLSLSCLLDTPTVFISITNNRTSNLKLEYLTWDSTALNGCWWPR